MIPPIQGLPTGTGGDVELPIAISDVIDLQDNLDDLQTQIDGLGGGGTLDGGGTAGHLAKWTDADTLGDSAVTIDINSGLGIGLGAQQGHMLLPGRIADPDPDAGVLALYAKLVDGVPQLWAMNGDEETPYQLTPPGAGSDSTAWHRGGDTLAATGKIGATSGAYGFDLYASGARCGRILATGELIIGTGAAPEFSIPSNIAEFRRDQVDPTIVSVVNKDSSATSNAIAEFIAKNDSSDGSIRLSMTGTGWNSHSGVVAGEGVLWMYNANLVIATHDNYKIRWLLNSNDLGDMDPATGFFTWNNAIRAPIMKAYAATTTAYFEATDGVTAAVANGNEGRLRYNNTTKTWQTSSDGGGWTSMLVGSGTATYFTSWTSAGVLQNGNLKQVGGDILPITTGLNLGNYQEPFANIDAATFSLHAAPGDTRQIMFLGNDGTYVGINIGPGGSSLMDCRFARTGTKSLVFDDGAGGNLTEVNFKAGITVGAPTGGVKGAGTINAAGDIYKNNSAYTNPDYVFEHWALGRIEKFKDNEGAKGYVGRMTLDKLEAYCRKHLRLPGISDEELGVFGRTDFILEKIEEIFTHLFDLKRDIGSRAAMAA